MNDPRPSLSRRAEQLDIVTKPVRNLVWLGALALALWVQFLGPGLSSVLREMSGSNALQASMERGFEVTNARLSFIEDNMAPPKIINWIEDRPIGICNAESCRKMHTISRTAYGESCGLPDIKIELRLENGDKFPMTSNFRATEAGILNSRIIHDMNLEDYVPNGVHAYQFTLLYPDCEWSREPLPRFSPWFDLVVTR